MIEHRSDLGPTASVSAAVCRRAEARVIVASPLSVQFPLARVVAQAARSRLSDPVSAARRARPGRPRRRGAPRAPAKAYNLRIGSQKTGRLVGRAYAVRPPFIQ